MTGGGCGGRASFYGPCGGCEECRPGLAPDPDPPDDDQPGAGVRVDGPLGPQDLGVVDVGIIRPWTVDDTVGVW